MSVCNMLRQTLVWFDLSMTTLGLLGNAVTVTVLCQAALRSSTSVLLLTMAVCDSFYLITNLIMPVDGVPYFALDINVGVIITVEYTCISCSVYTVVMVTLERYLAVSHPLRARRLCTIRKALKCVAVIFTVSLVFCVSREFSLFKETIGNTTTSVSCSTESSNWKRPFQMTVYCYISPAIVILLIPFSMILVFNLLIVRALVKRKKVVRRLSNEASDTGSCLTRTAVGITMCYFICCVFPGIYYVVIAFKRPSDKVMKIMSDVANTLIVVNCSTNFILYCLLGKTFRQVLIAKIKYCPVVTWYRSNGLSRPNLSDSSVFETVHLKNADIKRSSNV